MKWIEPENGGKGIFLNLSMVKTMRMYDDRFIRFDEFSGTYPYWEYPDESSRDADFERIRRIALGIVDHAEKKSSENSDPYEVDWSKIPANLDYVATASDGYTYAWPELPEMMHSGIWYISNCKLFEVGKVNHNPDWKNSLRIRPGTEKANA